jgi:hypothetical protein
VRDKWASSLAVYVVLTRRVLFQLSGTFSAGAWHGCGVKKLDRYSDLAVRKLADPASDCPDAVVHAVRTSVLAAPPALPLRPR